MFKKPCTLPKMVDFVADVGPECVRLRQNGKVSNSISGEIAGDFMSWPTGKHRFGWYLEPASYHSLRADAAQSATCAYLAELTLAGLILRRFLD